MHALIDVTTLTDLGRRKDFGGVEPPSLSHKTAPQKWVPVVNVANPPFDPDTERLVRAAAVITLTELTQSRKVEDLSQAEIDAIAEQKAHDADNNKDNWIATFKAGNGTGAQVQTALAWVLREITGP